MLSLGREGANSSCSAPGIDDLYGLGVRISLYIQYVAVLFASFTRSREQFHRVRDLALLSGFAITITLFHGIADHALNAIDVQTVCGLYFGQVAVVLLDFQWPDPGFWAPAVVLIYFYGFSAFFIWFWWHGLDVIDQYPCPDSYAFGFTKVNLYGPFRNSMKFSSIFTPIYILLSRANAEAHFGFLWLRPAASVLFLALTIPSVEFTIKFNHISNVNSIREVSQLIPLIISTLLVLYVLLRTPNADELPKKPKVDNKEVNKGGMTTLSVRDIELGGKMYARTVDGRVLQLSDEICACHGGQKILKVFTEQEFAELERYAAEEQKADTADEDIEAGLSEEQHSHIVEEHADEDGQMVICPKHGRQRANGVSESTELTESKDASQEDSIDLSGFKWLTGTL